VVVDSLGVTGATYGGLAKLDEARVHEMLALRPYDLVIFMLGTNFWNTDENPEGLRRLIERHRSVTPGVPILVLTPPDHVKTKHSTRSDPRILRVVEQLQTAARSAGVALWDFREAMGGDGSMWVFRQRGLAGDDMYHLTDTGARIMGHRLAYAFLSGYAAFVAKHPQAGCLGD
jgi:lysophospholipase L1-like esterase